MLQEISRIRRSGRVTYTSNILQLRRKVMIIDWMIYFYLEYVVRKMNESVTATRSCSLLIA